MLKNHAKGLTLLLEESIARYRVPGASLAVLWNDEIIETASGVVNRNTGVKATPDAVFQIGSITKVFTTTLIMQLVDEGLVELDVPIRTYLPELQLGDHEAAQTITVRHLLCHQSGIDGDFFQDTGRGEDCLERFILACSALGQLHVPGQMFSYCNAGFSILGRIIEKVRGMIWDDVLQNCLLEPIGADSMHTRPEMAVYYRAAIGHVLDPETGEFKVATVPNLAWSNGPAGSTPFAAARDLLTFSQIHLDNGIAANGNRALSETSVQQMQEKQINVPVEGLADARGLGWMLCDWDNTRIIGHDGTTLGQNAYLRISPSHNLAVALFANGGNAAAFYRKIYNEIFGELVGISLPDLPNEQSVDLDHTRYIGTYERLASRLIVESVDDKLVMTQVNRRPLLPAQEQDVLTELRPVNESLFYWTAPGSKFKNYINFLEFGPDGSARYLHSGGRSAKRTC
jgi:CubicO group peptidase (beta-lactamase class C family)